MNNILRFTFLLVALALAQFAHAQLTKLSSNTDLSGFALNSSTAILESEVDHSLWTTNGTAEGTVKYTTKVRRDEDAGAGVLNGKAYFGGVDPDNGSELWVTDGTDAGTLLVKDINTGTNNSAPDDFFPFNGQLLFTAETEANGIELWKTDGTGGGTVLLKDINPGTGDSKGDFLGFFANNGVVYFVANDGEHGQELWKTDGTADGTVLVKDINPGAGNGIANAFVNSIFGQFIAMGSLTLFPANDGSGEELWKTDGTGAGTVKVKDINASITGSAPSSFVPFNNKIFFSATSVAEGAELWVTDGTTEGTNLVKDINPGAEPSVPNLFFSMIFGNKLIFSATDAATGTELWSTDGTEGGTTLFKDINPGAAPSGATLLPGFNPTDLSFSSLHTPPLNGKAFIMATTENEGMELWITDGTPAGTVLVKDINPGAEDGTTGSYFYTNNGIFFTGTDPTSGAELWKSDGTAAGTTLVQDINTGAGDSDPGFALYFNEHLYFSANDGVDNNDAPDLFILDDAIVLPVRLFNFAATVLSAKAVKLTWSTTNELNSSHFDVERSGDGIHFSNIDKVNAAGNSSLQQQYQYVDREPAHLSHRVLYYRLKMFDKDASYKYSQVLAVHFKESSFRFTFSPNPVQNQLSVIVAAPGSKSVALRIIDGSGKQVYQQTLSSSQNIAQQNINVAAWQKGVYFIQLVTDNSVKTQKFIKQ